MADAKPRLPIQVTITGTEDKSSMGGLKSYTAYCIEVVDFGRTFTIERRFDDFQKLHSDLLSVDSAIPPLPEKKMFASTDASVVAERRPAFERILRHLLHSEEVAFESQQFLFKFLDLPTPSVVVFRYLRRPDRRTSYVKQCAKLLDQKYEKEHAFRLAHHDVIKVNLELLSSDGLLAKPSGSADTSDMLDEDSESKTREDGVPTSGGPTGGGQSSPTATGNDQELETSVIEMVRHAVLHGEEARKCFLEANGVGQVLQLLLRIAQRPNAPKLPDQRVRNVLNALIQAEGERYPQIFSEFLARGGVAILAGFGELCKQHGGFAEFIGKALWLAWEIGTQRAFFESESSSPAEALALLGALFGSASRSGRIMAGLLLSTLIANGLFAGDSAREAKAAAGLEGLLEELLLALPTSGAPCKSEGEDVQAFVITVAKNERSFNRIMSCAASPANTDSHGTASGTAIWSACSFALWCLVVSQPKQARVAKLRPFLPGLAQGGPPSARWLIGELLLHLNLSADGAAGGGASGANPSAVDNRLMSEAAFHEQGVVETAMSERVSTAMAQLQGRLETHRGTLDQQKSLVEVRQQPLAVTQGGTWSSSLDAALSQLEKTRERLASISTSALQRETTSTDSLTAFTQSLEPGSSDSTTAEMERMLQSVLEVETAYQEKKEELQQHDTALTTQTEFCETCSKEMSEADKAVETMRRTIADLEQDISARQREAQMQRTLASSDVGSIRARANSEIEQLEKKMTNLREQAGKIQNGEPLKEGEAALDPAKAQETMAQLKNEAAQCKQRRTELASELQRMTSDPAAANEEALRLEAKANELRDRLSLLRNTELMQLEQAHAAKRDAWQTATTQMQEIRVRKDAAERACSSVQQELESRWRNWRPLWSQRLNCWHDRAAALGEAQLRGQQLDDALTGTWSAFQEEQRARQEVLQAVQQAQESLSALASQMIAVGDLQ